MRILKRLAVAASIGLALAASIVAQRPVPDNFDRSIRQHGEDLWERGRQIFRYDTFGDEDFWGGALQLHRAIAGERLGGVGPGVSPATALAVGLKVDIEALPAHAVQALRHGRVDLDDPAVTLQLLDANAVVGVKGFRGPDGRLSSVGIQCAFCHSDVDDSFAPGVGRRLDGWPNRDLNVGAIVALSPDLSVVADLLGTDQATVRTVLHSWGPGKFDAQLFLDGKAFRPDGRSAATLIPAAFGLAGVNLHTYTGWGGVSHWNAFVANLEMHGKGTFVDARLERSAAVPGRLSRGVRQRAERPGPHHVQAAGAALLPALDSGAEAVSRLVQCDAGRTGPAGVQRRGRLHGLPRTADLHRARVERSHGGRDWYRRLPVEPFARRTLPHDAACRTVGAADGRLLP